jgi:hypothetical protein
LDFTNIVASRNQFSISILVTVASRLILTVLFCLVGSLSPPLPLETTKLESHAKKVQWETEDEVLPQMQTMAPQRSGTLFFGSIYMHPMVSCRYVTLSKRGTEGTAIEAWSIVGINYGRTCAKATACVRVFFAGVRAIPQNGIPTLIVVPSFLHTHQNGIGHQAPTTTTAKVRPLPVFPGLSAKLRGRPLFSLGWQQGPALEAVSLGISSPLTVRSRFMQRKYTPLSAVLRLHGHPNPSA